MLSSQTKRNVDCEIEIEATQGSFESEERMLPFGCGSNLVLDARPDHFDQLQLAVHIGRSCADNVSFIPPSDVVGGLRRLVDLHLGQPLVDSLLGVCRDGVIILPQTYLDIGFLGPSLLEVVQAFALWSLVWLPSCENDKSRYLNECSN